MDDAHELPSRNICCHAFWSRKKCSKQTDRNVKNQKNYKLKAWIGRNHFLIFLILFYFLMIFLQNFTQGVKQFFGPRF